MTHFVQVWCKMNEELPSILPPSVVKKVVFMTAIESDVVFEEDRLSTSFRLESSDETA